MREQNKRLTYNPKGLKNPLGCRKIIVLPDDWVLKPETETIKREDNKMRGDFQTLSSRLQQRHLKNTESLNKVTIGKLDTYTTDQVKEVLQKLMNSEIFSLRITRPLFIKKIKMVCKYLREDRNINLKQ